MEEGVTMSNRKLKKKKNEKQAIKKHRKDICNSCSSTQNTFVTDVIETLSITE